MTDCALHFRIDFDRKINVTEYAKWEFRGECALELLVDLIENWPELFVGRSGAICYRDAPPEAEWAKDLDLRFCTTKRIGQPSSFLPFPCPYGLRWPQVGIPDAEKLMEGLLADRTPFTDARIFWIGANTHPSRRALLALGRNASKIFDVEIMRWARDADGRQFSTSRQVSLPEHARYKYLIDCPGNGYSARLKWLLATGRPVFIIDREIVEPWHEDLEPWVHFIPVASDLSDLLDHHARLESDPSLYEAIASSGRQFAADHLTVEARLIYTADAVGRAVQDAANPARFASASRKTDGTPLKIITVHSGNLLPLYENFAASLDAPSHGIRHCSRAVDTSSFTGTGFQSGSWYEMLCRQVEHALHVMTHEVAEGEYFIVSDVDIHFFKPQRLPGLVGGFEADGVEFAALLDQDDYYNSGFIILRKCPRILQLYTSVLDGLKRRRLPFADQDEINRLLPIIGVKHRPISPRIGVLGKQPVHEETVFYHATFADDLATKLRRIDTAKRQMEKEQYGVWQDF